MPAINELKSELKRLSSTGLLLYYAMADELGVLGDEAKRQLKDQKIALPSFSAEYDAWYSVALRVVTQIVPDRADDFILQYKDPKRKEISFLTYTISDYLIGLRTTFAGSVVADSKHALPKMKRQSAILEAAKAAFDSGLTNLVEVVQADLFDSELDAAADLAKRGFVRAGGAVAGVVLERHLLTVAHSHGAKSRKKHLTIGDLSQLLKEADVVDTAKWRFIQHLADLRNLCDHAKEREPTKDDASELIEGVKKVIKTVS